MPKSPLPAYLSAGLLAALTLSVFGAARSGGPESAVRRLNEAIIQRNAAELRSAMLQDFAQSRNAAILVQRIGSYLAVATDVEYGRTSYMGRYATVPVTYRAGTREVHYYFVLMQARRGWRVDADATESSVRNLLGIH